MSDDNRLIVNTKLAPQPVGAYSQAIRVTGGDLLFIAGQVALDVHGKLVGAGDAAAQTGQILENIRQVLASQGATMRNVVEFTTYAVGRASVDGLRQARAEVYEAQYPEGDYPPNTLLIIDGLASEEFLVEISAVAVLP